MDEVGAFNASLLEAKWDGDIVRRKTAIPDGGPVRSQKPGQELQLGLPCQQKIYWLLQISFQRQISLAAGKQQSFGQNFPALNCFRLV
jgi:hypothetical protein